MGNVIRWEHKQFAIHMLPRLKQLEEHCRKRGIQLPEPPPCQSPRDHAGAIVGRAELAEQIQPADLCYAFDVCVAS